MARACPICSKPVAWEGNPFRPFCSERCRLVDLGAWLGERYRIPGEPVDTPERDDEQDEAD
ncbi:MAG: DNA gyrase inhibitor YacG [Candidatus Binatia bacterium]|nr:MAG: DNA gyrase inhibitor YacG [Candidatus Binatia bacterium]